MPLSATNESRSSTGARDPEATGFGCRLGSAVGDQCSVGLVQVGVLVG